MEFLFERYLRKCKELVRYFYRMKHEYSRNQEIRIKVILIPSSILPLAGTSNLVAAF